jgi:hypothetical protein
VVILEASMSRGLEEEEYGTPEERVKVAAVLNEVKVRDRPDPVVVADALRVREVDEGITETVVPAGIPVPVTLIPATMPAVELTDVIIGELEVVEPVLTKYFEKVRDTAPEAVAGALRVTEGLGVGLGLTALTVAPAGMPAPVTVIPATMPVVVATVIVVELEEVVPVIVTAGAVNTRVTPLATLADALRVREVDEGITETVAPAGIPVPVTVMPTMMPVAELTATATEPPPGDAAVVVAETVGVMDETVAQFAVPPVFPVYVGPKHRT